MDTLLIDLYLTQRNIPNKIIYKCPLTTIYITSGGHLLSIYCSFFPTENTTVPNIDSLLLKYPSDKHQIFGLF